MEKLFYKPQHRLTVKEINEYADSIKDKTDIECKVCEWIDTFRCMYPSHAFTKPYYSSDFPYAVELSISEENGHVIAYAYDYEEYNKWQSEFGDAMEKMDNILIEEWCNITLETLKEKFSFEFPVTRGFSDTPERIDTAVSSDLDIECAIDEYIAEREGKQNVYPWMIKQMMSSEELGVTEEEYDTLLEETLA